MMMKKKNFLSDKMQFIYNIIENKYEHLYKIYISKFSISYLKGSPIYIGNSLLEWWLNFDLVNDNKKLDKLDYIIEVLNLMKI